MYLWNLIKKKKKKKKKQMTENHTYMDGDSKGL